MDLIYLILSSRSFVVIEMTITATSYINRSGTSFVDVRKAHIRGWSSDVFSVIPNSAEGQGDKKVDLGATRKPQSVENISKTRMAKLSNMSAKDSLGAGLPGPVRTADCVRWIVRPELCD